MSRHVVMSQNVPEFKIKRRPPPPLEMDSDPFEDDDQYSPPLPRVTFYPYPTQTRSPSDEGIAAFSSITPYPLSPVASDSDDSLLFEPLPEDDADSSTSDDSDGSSSSSQLSFQHFTSFPSFNRTLIPNWTNPPARFSYFEYLKKQAAEARRREAERWLEKWRQVVAETILYRVKKVPKRQGLYRMSFGTEVRRRYVHSPLSQEIAAF